MNPRVMTILQEAVGAFRAGRFADALAASEAALGAAPGHVEALHLKAMALGRLGRTDEAARVFDETAARHPQRHAVLGNKGNALRAAGRAEEARAAYEAAVAANPRFAPGWAGLGAVLRDAENYEGAQDAFRRALETSPKDAGVMNNLGVVVNKLGRREEAVELFSTALALRPDMVSALVNRGAAYRDGGLLGKALEDHQKAVARAPSNAEAHYQRANTLRQAGKLMEAEAAYAAALALAPAREDIHSDLARMLWEMGEGGRFLDYLDRANATAPQAALLALESQFALLAGRLDAAETAARRAVEADAQSAAAHRVAGSVHRHQGAHAAAVGAFERALACAPEDWDARHELAEALLAHGEAARAADMLDADAPQAHLQKHIALKALAMRLSGDAGYRRYYDYDRFTRKMTIETPPDFPNLAAFNEALVDAIRPLHATKAQPIDQTLYGGTQSLGRLWDEPHPVIQALKDALLKAAAAYAAQLPDDPAHPFLAQKSADLECAGAWSVMLSSGGGHVDHIHPAGWISASYYVRVPEEVCFGGEKAGFLRLGASGVRGVDLEAERWFRPEEGAVVFFPSYMWHGVESFSAKTPRVTAPFDLKPR